MRKYYDDEDDFGEEAEKIAQLTFLPAERLMGMDWLLAGVVGVIVFLGLTLFPFPSLCPDVWNDAVVAAGLRTPTNIFPGFWRVLARICYWNGVGTGNTILFWSGRICAAFVAAGAFLLLRSLLSLLVRGSLRFAVRRYLIQRIAAFLASLFFCCSDPLWRAGQTFGPSGFLSLMTLVALALFTGFLLNGRLGSALAAMFILGSLAAETPMGFVFLAVCWAVYALALRRGALCEHMPLIDPIIGQHARWYLTFFWALGFVLGIAVNCASFVRMGGLAAAGASVGDLPLMYIVRWWTLMLEAASDLGWVLGVGVCVLPCVVAAAMLPRAVDEELFLPYHMGTVSFVTGSLTYTQLAMIAPLWYWTWSEMATVDSFYLQQVFIFCAAATFMFALMVFGADACCRNHVRLAMQRFSEFHEDGAARATDANARRGKRGGFVIFVVAGVLLAAGVLPGRILTRTREMLEVIEAYANEVIEECGPVKWIFTDGSFDAKLELLAAERGKFLSAVSFMSANTPHEQSVRLRGIEDEEDRLAMSINAPMALRTWMREKPARLEQTATQLGLELWKRDGREIPPCSGVLSRPLGMPEEERVAGVERSKAIAAQILDIYARGGLEKTSGSRIKDLFLFAQWRLARFARMRAERADRSGSADLAKVDESLSDKLDDRNESLQRILRDAKAREEAAQKSVTPRQNLRHALEDADFALASRVAAPILAADPNDPDANFGTAMNYYRLKQWARAEEHLKRAVKSRPNQPAFWNNLAMICLYTARFDEADAHAKKALELLPQSAEVKDTIRQIAEARRAAAEKKAKEEKERSYHQQ